MKLKVLAILVFLSLIQVIISCTDYLDDPIIYRYIFSDISVTAYNTAGFVSTIADGKVHKNAFGIEISFEKEFVQFSLPKSNIGFKTAYAEYLERHICVDNIVQLTIGMYDLTSDNSDELIDVTSQFRYPIYDGTTLTVEEYVQLRYPDFYSIELDLWLYETIPNTATFVATILFESGKIMSSQTNVVNFYD